MMKANYQHADVSLVPIERVPQSARFQKEAPHMVLAEDIDGDKYTLEGSAIALYRLGNTQYIEVPTTATFNYQDRAAISVKPGTYKLKKQSAYVHVEHGREVAPLALLMGRALSFDEQHLKELEFACVMHDIGLKGMEQTLWKVDWFTDDDWKTVVQHPARGADVIKRLKGRHPLATDRVADYILHHHAHYDGSGYAQRIAGQEIPVGSRIMLIADAYHAMTSWRPFREPLADHVALRRLWDDAGHRYDRELLDSFTDALDQVAIDEFLQCLQ